MRTDESLSFGEVLRRRRLAAGLSQEELAGRAGLSPRGISDLERGARTTPRPATVRLLADALGLTDDERAAFLADALGIAAPGVIVEPEATPKSTTGLDGSATSASELPSGTATFLFTDIEGSTRLLQELGPRYADMLGRQQRILRAAFAAHGGYEVDTQGDSFFAAFPTARDALACAVEAQRALESESWPEGTQVRVRMGLHSGAPQLVGSRYVGLDVHRAARIAAAGYGGQVLLSAAAAELVRRDLPDDTGITLLSLGLHRLKDLRQPEHLYQLVVPGMPSAFPALKALDVRPHNLPVQPSLILGREREIEVLCALLRRDDVRLVTLTGSGGVGKTRLSVQVAAEVLDAFPDGVWNVRLSRLTDPALVVSTIAATLDLKESGATRLAEVLRSYLRDKRLLLVLDNFEQVVGAAPNVGELLDSAPGLKVLVTSRVPLHLRGEREFGVKPLALPDPTHLPPPERLSQYAAVALFIERAQAAQTDFQVTSANAAAVAEICARLDGLPLAIELAAARVKLLPPQALLTRLQKQLAVLTGGARDVDARQQTMRNTLAWSYDLLTTEERRLFCRLAVFVGGCSLEAAEAVCAAPAGAEPLGIDLLDGLSALVDQSLLQMREEGGEPRFSLLYVIREFALEQLEASGEVEALRRAHFLYCLVMAWQEGAGHKDQPRGAELVTWLDRLEREQDNMRAALTWARDQDELELALRLGGALGFFWYARGRLGEGRRWLDGLLEQAARARDGAVRPVVHARALLEAGVLSQWGADLAAAGSHLERSARLATGAGDMRVATDAHQRLALIACLQGDLPRAIAGYAECVRMARQTGYSALLSVTLSNQGYTAYHVGDLDGALTSTEEALALAREVGDWHGETIDMMSLGEIARRRGDLAGAVTHLGEALRLARRVGDPRLYAETLEYMAMTLAGIGNAHESARLLGAAATLREPIGFPQPPVDAAETESAVSDARAAIGEVAWQAAYDAGRALSLEEAVAEASTVAQRSAVLQRDSARNVSRPK